MKSLPVHEIDENIVFIIQPKPGIGIENWNQYFCILVKIC